MKIKLNEKNLLMVAGILNKFFNNKPVNGFYYYYNFNCGWKNIKPFFNRKCLDKSYSKTKISVIEGNYIYLKGHDNVGGDICVYIDLNDLLFMSGNKIIIQKKQDSNNFRYQVIERR